MHFPSFLKIKLQGVFEWKWIKDLFILHNLNFLTHWGRVMHICVGNLTTIGSNNGLSPDWCQAIIWTSAGILLIGPLRTNFSEIFSRNYNIFIQENVFESVVCEMASILSRPQCVKGKGNLQELKADDMYDIWPWHLTFSVVLPITLNPNSVCLPLVPFTNMDLLKSQYG